MNNPDPSSASYLLGEMVSSMRNIDHNVNAMRTELGDLTRRVSATEKDVATMQAERRAIMPEYTALVSGFRAHVQADTTWKSKFEGGTAMAKGSGRLIAGLLSVLITIGLFVAGQMWMDHRAVAARPTATQQGIPHTNG